MISSNLPALQIVIPLLSAPICVILRDRRIVWAFAQLITLFAFGCAVALTVQVLQTGPISYEIGNWQAPWGIEYRIDLLNAFMLIIVSAIGAITMPYARVSVAKEIPQERIYLFYTMYLLSMTGLLGIAITGDAFNLFVFLEISALSSYVLISLGEDRRALTAAYRYLVMGTLGATFYIIGVGLMYMMTGTLNMADLVGRLPGVAHTTTILAALAFITCGVSLKLALFPLHLWLPNAYAFAPSVVTVFLAATATKVSVYVLLRVFFTIFGGVDLFIDSHLADILMALALVGMFTMSAVAIYQKNLKRMLAFSSVAQIGYMVLGISFVSVLGLTGTIIHLFNHALMKGALFMALGCIVFRTGSVDIKDMAGMGRRMPVTMAAFVVAGLSMIGVPLTVGFVSKWYLVLAALEQDAWWIALLVLLSSLLAVVYIWRVIEVAYFRPVPEGAPPIKEAPLSMLLPMWLLTGGAVFFGVHSTLTVDIARAAATFLLGDRQ